MTRLLDYLAICNNERAIFCNRLLSSRSADDPMPPALNNKFDALPPAEGLVFDFVFDFKARGQWKHWNDIVKNSEIPEKLSPNALIPTVDTARYFTSLCPTLSFFKKYFFFNFLFHNSHDKFDGQIIVSNQMNQIES